MKITKYKVSENIALISFSLYFVFNFYDRSISNIFLLLCLAFCLVSYKNLYFTLKANSQLVKAIIIFTVYISVLAVYHKTPISELDNYYRFLLLLPLILITLNENRIKILIFVCAVLGMIHAFYNGAFYGINLYPVNVYRYEGTSSVAITYANMCATLFVMCLYYIFYRNDKSFINITSTIIFLVLFILTETRGPIIGIILTLLYMAYAIRCNNKNNINSSGPIVFLFVFLVLLTIVPNPIFERIQIVLESNLENPSKIVNASIRERTYFLNFGIDKIKNHYLFGIGPQNTQSSMSESLESQGITNITASDHIHNEFLDIILKFGVVSIVLLFLIYFSIVTVKNTEDRVLLTVVMIMLLSSQLTQSQFAHHQAITFFISIFYIFMPKIRSSK